MTCCFSPDVASFACRAHAASEAQARRPHCPTGAMHMCVCCTASVCCTAAHELVMFTPAAAASLRAREL